MTESINNVHKDLFINGEWINTADYKDLINPATGKVIAKIAQADETQVEDAIQAAYDAFQPWKSLELKDRTQYLHNIADLLEEHADRLAEIMTIEQGKSIKESKLEVIAGAESFRWNAEEARRLYGETIPAPNDHKYEIAYEPVGVVGAITPWNFPSGMITRKIAPALAAGNTVVLKPSSDTPLSALAIFELFEQAELPKGVANIVMGSSKEIGEAMTSSKLVKKITFTGSTPIGKALYAQSADTLKKMSLELGGHAPFIINADADIDAAVEGLMAAKFRNNGQVCIAPNRIFVHKSIKDNVLKQLTEKVEALKVGNGLNEDTNVGPLIREDAIDKIKKQIINATDKGATLVTGGHRLTGDEYDNGFFFQPTILDNVNRTMDIFYEETFGPVIPIITFDTLEEVIEMANDSEFGLASYAYAKDSKTIQTIATSLEYGMVGINEVAISNPETPFGGVKHSGFGRENSHLGIKEYVTAKFINTKFL
ncbi:NAD-dependent succinate-semialdehyde dehydrogenase [Macrococcoides bohemicum]|uniref:Aldehyde dehydrogenase n=1 Tax=Macrococcoides bohemicum TaxID=1903056 RepID=A0AAJ4TXJ3_9STAP|nr:MULTISPECIES: NAD-dependent succinate-semialdehyde dehydrogenase [Macrococcus]ATD31404.1 succinate-semialdehyde dehydrogenase (NADP(+)) [Macrococcus sp. IME1552]QYA42612.1 NAD-dependent succinate-semialdehyde dehydrogenase [Macrococcus bohemicus]TDL33311.1 NAD-dependent succinate-semialdehyde dehydrogenase [Macrococcus bohemicus]